MSILIENYRGWDILFDTDSDCFYVESDEWDQKKTRKSFTACKSFIDQYIKDNDTFKPFKAQHKTSGEIVNIVGIRKDGRLVYDQNGKKKQMPDYDLRSWIRYNPENDSKFLEIERLDYDIKVLMAKKDAILEAITGQSLKEIQKSINPL